MCPCRGWYLPDDCFSELLLYKSNSVNKRRHKIHLIKNLHCHDIAGKISHLALDSKYSFTHFVDNIFVCNKHFTSSCAFFIIIVLPMYWYVCVYLTEGLYVCVYLTEGLDLYFLLSWHGQTLLLMNFHLLLNHYFEL